MNGPCRWKGLSSESALISTEMAMVGICDICGGPATGTCKLCGKLVCRRCLDGATGICKGCSQKGERFVDDLPRTIG